MHTRNGKVSLVGILILLFMVGIHTIFTPDDGPVKDLVKEIEYSEIIIVTQDNDVKSLDLDDLVTVADELSACDVMISQKPDTNNLDGIVDCYYGSEKLIVEILMYNNELYVEYKNDLGISVYYKLLLLNNTSKSIKILFE